MKTQTTKRRTPRARPVKHWSIRLALDLDTTLQDRLFAYCDAQRMPMGEMTRQMIEHCMATGFTAK